MKKLLQNTSIRMKMLLSYFLILLVLMSVMTYSFYPITKSIVIKEVKTSNMEILNQINKNLDYLIEEMASLSGIYSLNPAIQDILRLPSSNNQYDRVEDVDKYTDVIGRYDIAFRKFEYFPAIYAFNNRNYVSEINNYSKFLEIPKQNWFKDIVAKDGGISWIPNYSKTGIFNSDIRFLLAARLIKDTKTDKPLGVLMLNLSENILFNTYHNETQENLTFLIDADGNIISHPDKKEIGKNISSKVYIKTILTSGGNGNITTSIAGKDNVVSYNHIEQVNWYVVTVVPVKNMLKNLNVLPIFLIPLVMLCIILSLLLSYFITKSIASPLKDLQNRLEISENGDLDIVHDNKNKNEVSQLNFSFNNMISKIKNLMENIVLEKELLDVTLHSIGDAVITTDINGNITAINKVAQELTGWSDIDAIGMPMQDVFHIINEFTREICENPAKKVLISGSIVMLANHTVLVSKNGREISIADSGAPIKSKDGSILGVVVVFRDVTEKKKREDEIEYLSFHDKLTGLYNRAYFEEELSRMGKSREVPLSIIIGDVNGLKLANDVFGHLEGDNLLVEISKILSNCIRAEDVLARWGGDEFAIILPKTDENEAFNICSRINKVCQASSSEPIPPSISLGYATRYSSEPDLRKVIKEAEDRMYRHKLLESKSARSSIISSLEKTLFERSFETEEHAKRMREIAVEIGIKAGLSETQLDEISLFAILHDIGKIAISDNILDKPGKLTPEEWVEMKKHPEIGFRIADSSPELSHIADYILTHHERWDGNGYPQGLKGLDIPKLSRILTVVDSYDVMTNSRPYKEAISKEDALLEIEKCSGSQFDPEMAKLFIEVMSLPE